MSRKYFFSSAASHDEKLIMASDIEPLAPMLWPYLITRMDDWGRAEASVISIKAESFPLFEIVTRAVIESSLKALDSVGLIELYEVNGRRYMAFEPEKWFGYQSHVRGEKRLKDGSKYPMPESHHAFWDNTANPREDSCESGNNQGTARSCVQTHADARNCTPSPSPSPSPSPTDSEIPPTPNGGVMCPEAEGLDDESVSVDELQTPSQSPEIHHEAPEIYAQAPEDVFDGEGRTDPIIPPELIPEPVVLTPRQSQRAKELQRKNAKRLEIITAFRHAKYGKPLGDPVAPGEFDKCKSAADDLIAAGATSESVIQATHTALESWTEASRVTLRAIAGNFTELTCPMPERLAPAGQSSRAAPARTTVRERVAALEERTLERMRTDTSDPLAMIEEMERKRLAAIAAKSKPRQLF